ncbi:MAG: signal recognition particle-docking protein FtsY [Oscillospiraceae bacterium]|nr:signal recognition particle-docking protein FtsY [Oscillospiraceae bacterium]
MGLFSKRKKSQESVQETLETQVENPTRSETPEIIAKPEIIESPEPSKPLGLFGKLKAGLQKTKDNFSEGISRVVNSFTKIDEEFFEELEETLILSDLGVQTADEICEQLRAEIKRVGATDTSVITGMLRQIITQMLTGDNELKLTTSPSVVLVIGVNGAGKTTTIGKLAANLRKDGKKVLIAAADTFRAAAIEQLSEWANRAEVDIVKHAEGADPAAVAYDACNAAKSRGVDVLLIDTAGRLHNKKHLMEELKKIARSVNSQLPDCSFETLLVLDATTGQNAVNQARLFNQVTAISGIALTKLDGTAKGGIIVSIKNELGIPVKLVGVGEKLDDLQPFVPEDYVNVLFPDGESGV